MNSSFKSKSHIPYQLKGKEIRFYINVTNGEFWYNKIHLSKVPPTVSRRQASDDIVSSENESDEEKPIICGEFNQLNDQSSADRMDVLGESEHKRLRLAGPSTSESMLKRQSERTQFMKDRWLDEQKASHRTFNHQKVTQSKQLI